MKNNTEKIKAFLKNRYFKIGVLIISILVVPYIALPAIVLWWFFRKSMFSRKSKIIITSFCGGLIVVGIVWSFIAYARDIDPTLTVTEPPSVFSIQDSRVTIKGNYEPTDRSVWVNGTLIPTSGGFFETSVALEIGENKIDVRAGNWKMVHVYLTVTRELTEEEKVQIEAEKQAQLEKEAQEKVQLEKEMKAQQEKEIQENLQIENDKKTQQKMGTQEKLSIEEKNTPKITTVDKLWLAVDTGLESREGIDVVYKEYSETVWLSFTSDSFLDENHIVREAYEKLVRYGNEVFKLNEIADLEIVIKIPTVDSYGNESISKVVYIKMSKEEFNKFNWEGLKYRPVSDQIERAASEYYVKHYVQVKTDKEELYLTY